MKNNATERSQLKKKLVFAGLAALFLVLLITAFFGKKGWLEIYKVRKNYDALLREVEALRQEKSRLEKEIQELMNNPKAVEREAREKLWLIKPDEKVLVKKKR